MLPTTIFGQQGAGSYTSVVGGKRIATTSASPGNVLEPPVSSPAIPESRGTNQAPRQCHVVLRLTEIVGDVDRTLQSYRCFPLVTSTPSLTTAPHVIVALTIVPRFTVHTTAPPPPPSPPPTSIQPQVRDFPFTASAAYAANPVRQEARSEGYHKKQACHIRTEEHEVLRVRI